MNDKKDLENYLKQHIPITSAIGVHVDFVSKERVVLGAPFEANINHKNTVFGGSLNALATLACWSLLHVNLSKVLKDHVQIVISSSEISFLSPVNSDFKAESSLSNLQDWDRFIQILSRRGKGRLTLQAKIFQDNVLCVEFTGVFAAIKINEKPNGTEL